MNYTIAARPTNYRGTQMRSRLEATYAELCDNFQLPWQYEPGALAGTQGQWLPDFVHTIDYGDDRVDYHYTTTNVYVDIKPPPWPFSPDAEATLTKWANTVAECDPGSLAVAALPVAGKGIVYVGRHLTDGAAGRNWIRAQVHVGYDTPIWAITGFRCYTMIEALSLWSYLVAKGAAK
jgi:hypothetical protein